MLTDQIHKIDKETMPSSDEDAYFCDTLCSIHGFPHSVLFALGDNLFQWSTTFFPLLFSRFKLPFGGDIPCYSSYIGYIPISGTKIISERPKVCTSYLMGRIWHRDSTADTWRKYFGASQSQSVRIGKLRYFGSKTRVISWDLSEFVMSSTTIWGSKSGSAISTTAMIKPRGVGNWHRFVDGRSEITWLPIFLMRKVCLSKEIWHSASAQTWKTMEDSKSEYTFPKAACEPTINHSLKWYWMILM